MPYLVVVVPFIFIAWLVYSSRDVLLWAWRFLLHRRYDAKIIGRDVVDPHNVYLVLPNHPAIVEPMIVVSELHKLKINVSPLADESLFPVRLMKQIPHLFNALRFSDSRRDNLRSVLKLRPTLRDSSRRAKALGYSVLAALCNGRNILVYPSGNITLDGRERMINRQLAYNVISQLPDEVRVLGVRTRGFYGSIWSRVGGRPMPPLIRTFIRSSLLWLVAGFRPKRKIVIHLEDITDISRNWAAQGRIKFNEGLENWYDSDLRSLGRNSEEAT